jgi:alkylation response protein AidB-like acyl-CoA dehydrogenase
VLVLGRADEIESRVVDQHIDTAELAFRIADRRRGGSFTSELFFNDLRVPVSNRLGDEGAGFAMMMTKLAYSDEVGRLYRSEVGHRSDAKRAACTDPKRAI